MTLVRTTVGFAVLLFAGGCGVASHPSAPHPPAPPMTKVAAEERPYAEPSAAAEFAGVAYVLPSGWRSERANDSTLLSTADGRVRIAILAGHTTRDDAMGKAIQSEVERVVTELAPIGLPEGRLVNGARVTRVVGTGIHDGRFVNWSAHRFAASKPVVVVAFAAPREYERYQPEIDRFVGSVKTQYRER